MRSIHPSPWLKNALRADAAVSGATGALQLAAAEPLSSLLALPHGLLWGSGEFMLGYAALLWWMASRGRLPVPLVLLIVAGNVLWAVACVALPIGGLLAPNALSTGYLVIQAATVLLLARLQWLGLKRSGSAIGAASRSAGEGSARGGRA